MNRMRVYDAAPRKVQLAEQQTKNPDSRYAPLNTWWRGLTEEQQEAILAGKPCPEDRVALWSIFR